MRPRLWIQHPLRSSKISETWPRRLVSRSAPSCYPALPVPTGASVLRSPVCASPGATSGVGNWPVPFLQRLVGRLNRQRMASPHASSLRGRSRVVKEGKFRPGLLVWEFFPHKIVIQGALVRFRFTRTLAGRHGRIRSKNITKQKKLAERK